jgi:hypothetical protein
MANGNMHSKLQRGLRVAVEPCERPNVKVVSRPERCAMRA